VTTWKYCRDNVATSIAFVSTIIFVAACGRQDSPESQAITHRDSAGIKITANDLERLDATCHFGASPTVTIGIAEGDEEYQLYRVFGARRLGDGSIALVNQGSQQVRFYDQQGHFIGQTGREGEGPGEFRAAFHLWVLPGDTIWVGDSRPWRFLVFGPDRQWVRTVQAEPMYVNTPGVMSVLDDGRFVLAQRPRPSPPSTQFELSHLTVVLHNPAGLLIDTVGIYPNGRWGRMENNQRSMLLYPLFESFTRLGSTGSHIVIAHQSRAEFSILSAADEVRVEHIVRWTAGDRTISSADIRAERQRIVEPYEDVDPATRRRFVAPLVSEDRPVADKFPAFASLKPGRDGRIWVREYHRPTEPEPSRWLAFDSEGGFQCRATIPTFDEFLEFGADYVLVKDRDELGVERVFQYTLGPPADDE